MDSTIDAQNIRQKFCRVRNRVERFYGAVCKSVTGTLGRVCGDMGLGDARRRTWGHQVWDAGTCGTGTREVK